MMTLSITPSLPASTFEELESLARTLAPVVPMLQVDIVDGIFVPLKSWPFTESEPADIALRKLAQLPALLPIELDCMVMHPEQYLEVFAELGVHSVIVHMGSTDAYELIINHARQSGYKIGLALTNDIDVATLEPYISLIDFVQVMGIAHVGKQGQPFDTRTLETLATLRLKFPELPLSVDGAVNAETLLPLKEAGATRFAPGSAIAKASDPVSSYKQLCVLLGI